ncbi:MAG TPA: hypothetical protein VET85_09675 [Stellaceae bacterium]|nr:hypothetical protein [Stellaceae bacterium]
MLNPLVCPTRETPLKTRETQICYREAANLFHHRQYEDAQQVALGVLATAPRNVQILLLLKRISGARGDAESARDYAARALAEAREALAECKAGN